MGWFSGKRAGADIPTYEVTNTIGEGTIVKGDLKGKSFCINGTVDGLVDSEGPVQIGENGVVTGCVRATNLNVLGRVEGDIEASGHLEVGAKGRVIGDIHVKSFRMQTGGIFRGVSRMADETAPLLTGPRVSERSPLVSQKRLVAGAEDVDIEEVDVIESSEMEHRVQAAMRAK